jgi:hypothetical protein
MKTPGDIPFTAFIGIDWADAKHDICMQAAGDERREFSVLSHKVEAIDEWHSHCIDALAGRLRWR